jgi:hypothetical protein
MLKLPPAYYLALTDTFSTNSLSQIFYIVWSIKINLRL